MAWALDRDPRPRRDWIAGAVSVLAAVLFAVLLSSCSPKIIEKQVIKHDTTYVERVRVDSLRIKDSVYIREKGDTTYIYKESIRDRWRILRDTVRLVRVDSVAVERVKEVKVEKPLTGWQKFRMGAFWWLLGAVLALVAWLTRKWWLKLL